MEKRLCGIHGTALIVVSALLLGGCPRVTRDFVSPLAQKIFTGSPASGKYHVVQPAETLDQIADANKIPLKEIARANNLKPPYDLKVKKRLLIPTHRNAQAVPAQDQGPTWQPKASSLRGRLAWPVKGAVKRKLGLEDGLEVRVIEISARRGMPVRAAADGRVAFVRSATEHGCSVLIEHGDELVTVYGNLDETKVAEGAMVEQGQVIGSVGGVAPDGRPALQFEVHLRSKPVDPLDFLERET